MIAPLRVSLGVGSSLNEVQSLSASGGGGLGGTQYAGVGRGPPSYYRPTASRAMSPRGRPAASISRCVAAMSYSTLCSVTVSDSLS